MTPEIYNDLYRHFRVARRLPPEERQAYLSRVGADSTLGAELAALLDTDHALSSLMKRPAFVAGPKEREGEASVAEPLESWLESEPRIERIGRFRILDLLGRGGMGVVYRAESDHPHREVALKLLRLGRDTPSLVRRFELEADLLARLEHPGIAQIYEAGVADTPFGAQPYFAMELVRGPSLSTYVRSRRPTIVQRVGLLIQICDAVHHAHQKGVIHRDLKPSNILVAERAAGGTGSHNPTAGAVQEESVGRRIDGLPSATPKILDFGIARAVEDDQQMTTRQTMSGQVLGTVPYMSPEQLAGSPEAVDIRSDVYSLGVIAFELLAGRLPYDLEGCSLARMMERIRNDSPLQLRSIAPEYRGDLETIVAKAMEKEKERRYASAAQLAEDLRRYVRGDPITARPASLWYQLAKFAGRNRAVTAGATVGLLSLVAGLVVSTCLWREVVGQRNRAEAQAARAQAVKDLLKDTLASADPNQAKNPDVKLRDVLVRVAKRIKTGAIKAQPEVEAELQATIGQTYAALGLFSEAEPLLRSALETLKQRPDENQALIANVLQDLAALLREKGEFEEPRALYQEAMSIWQSTRGQEHPDVARCLNGLAALYAFQQDFAQAESLYRQALEMRLKLLGAEHVEVAESMNGVSMALFVKGDYHGAERLLRKVLEITRAVHGTEHRDVADSMHNLGDALWQQGKLDEAESMHRQALELNRRLLGAEHPDVAASMDSLANALGANGDYDGAARLYQDALQMRRRLLGPDHPTVDWTLHSLAALRHRQGRYSEAIALFRELLPRYQKLYGVEHPAVASMMCDLGSVLGATGDLEQAESVQREALEIRRRVLPAEDPNLAQSLNNLGSLLTTKGDYDSAATLLREALDIRRKVHGNEHPEVATCLVNLGILLARQGQTEKAEELHREALAMRRKLLGNNHPDVIWSLSHLANVLRKKRDYEAAEPLYREALELGRRLLGERHPEMVASISNLAGLLELKGEPGEAERLYRESIQLNRQLWGDQHDAVANSLFQLADLLEDQGRADEAERLNREGLSIRRALHGDQHPSVLDRTQKLNQLLEKKPSSSTYDGSDS